MDTDSGILAGGPDRRTARPSLPGRLAGFAAYVAREFAADRCVLAAAGLAYTTLLALVPLVTVVFITLSAFPAFQEARGQIEQWVFANFVPASGETVREYMHEFADKAAGLRALGLAVLVVTVLALMASIESAFDAIWRTPVHRRRWLRFLVYWAVLTLGPLLIGTGLAVTSYLVSLPLLSSVDATLGLSGKLLVMLPFATSFLAFVLLYGFLPGRDVPLAHAGAGALAAALAFEVAKRGFAIYIAYYPTQEAIYGAFATVPVFLFWIYLCWLIVLAGAVLTRCLGTYGAWLAARDAPPRGRLPDALRLLRALEAARATGETPDDAALATRVHGMPLARVDDLLSRLETARWVARTDAGGWTLLRDLNAVTLLDLYRIVPGAVPCAGGAGPAGEEFGALAAVGARGRLQAEDALRVPVASVLPRG